ncbi:MAG: hypothetical protein MR016_03735 [Agathobacter sp.]|nr:hypothetical protein [Agathobacter sp.]
MRILSCHVENFGKIHNLSLRLSDGMYVIKEPNAWGKSTLAAFIKVMFYGFDTKKEPGAFDKERNIYRPWQGGVYGGELEFEADGRVYRISRTFGKSEKADEFHLYDSVTNLECKDFSENIGEELFDLDSNSFRRSIYIGQNDCASQTTDAINAKLGNLVQNTNDINNYESAQEYLKNLANQLSPNRATGSIKKRRNQLAAIEQELRSYEAAEKAIGQLKKKQQMEQFNKDNLIQQRDTYAKQLKQASEESRRRELQKQYLALCESQQEKLAGLLPYTDIFPMGIPDEEELTGQMKNARKLEETQATLSHMRPDEKERETYFRLEEKFRTSIPEEEEIAGQLRAIKKIPALKDEQMRVEMKISEKEHEVLQQKEPQMRSTAKVMTVGIIGIILALAGVIGEIFGIYSLSRAPYGLWLTIGAAVLFLIGMILLIVGMKKRAFVLLVGKNEQMEWKERQESCQEEVKKLQEQELEKADQIAKLKNETEQFLQRYGMQAEEEDYASELYQLKDEVHEFEHLKEQYTRCVAFEENVKMERDELNAYMERIGQPLQEDVTTQLNTLAMEAAKYRMARENVEAAQQKVANFEKANDINELLQQKKLPFSIDQLNGKIKIIDEELEEVRGRIEQYARQMEDLEEQLDLRDEKEQELAELKELQEQQQDTYDTVMLTQDYLQRAREQFIARYMAPISNAFRKYYDLLVGISEENDWQIDANISFRKKEQGELRETKWLSAGYQDLIGVCMRLALADAMYPDEKPFLILDDPFVNLDDAKTKRGMQLLQKAAEDYQILYFTCHSSREPETK